MTFNISPAVTIEEVDLSLNVVTLANYVGASAGFAQWGPVNKPYLITSGETDFVNNFYTPNATTALDFFVMSDFLSYSPTAWFTRVVGPTAKNAADNAGAVTYLVRNQDEIDSDVGASAFTGMQYMAKYPGTLGNGIVIDTADATKFPTWEFKGSFLYPPRAGEYAIAVIDSTGNFSNGIGESKQTESLNIYGTSVFGGVQESRNMALSGTVTGGTQQVESVTFAGTSTGTAITVDGNVITIAAADSASAVAGKVATALSAITATYASAVAVGPVVNVTFKSPALRNAIATGSATGLTWSSVIQTAGNASSNVTLQGRTFAVNFGDSAASVATKLGAQLGYLTNIYANIVVTGANVAYQYVNYGVSTDATTTQTSDGISAAISVTTVGSSTVNLAVFGTTVAVLNGDSASTVATKIATALNGYSAFSSLYDSIAASGASVGYRRVVVGQQTAQTTPATQAGLTFNVSVVVAGKLGALLEKYEIVTTNPNDSYPDGTSRYFVNSIKQKSQYIFVADPTAALTVRTTKLAGGVDDYNTTRNAAISNYANSEMIDLNYIFTAGTVIEQKAVADVIDTRRDCVGFFSPMMNDVVNNTGNELAAVLAWRNVALNRDTSYGFNTDNWALIYDQYNDVNRWIPTCGGTAGLAARSANDFDPWISFAGTQRGKYLRYIKMAWSANKAQRDQLFPAAVNSIVTFTGDGIVLYGDKTSTSRPSSFDRINVRSAFIVAEKSIANFSKQFLFELNDAFTQAQFLNAVRPFLRQMVSRNAFDSFQVIADATTNTPQVVASNAFAARILLKPLYSINFVNLQFVAVGANVSFDEAEGSFA